MPKLEIVAKGAWWTIKAAADSDTVELLIYGDIGKDWWTGEGTDAIDMINALANAKDKRVKCRLNSFGGSVADGIAIYNAMKRHSGGCDVVVDAVAHSIASLIAMAGETVEMAENAMLMIHAPWGGCYGDANTMRDYADMLDTYAEAMATSYAAKSGQTKDAIMALLTDSKDHYYTAEQAKAAGFCDSIGPAKPAAAALASQFDLSRFKNSPPAAHHKPVPENPPMPPKPQNTGSTDPDAIRAEVQAAEKNRRNDVRALFKPILAQFADRQDLIDLQNTALDDPEMDIDKVRAKVLDALGKSAEPGNPPNYTPRVEAGRTSAEKMREGLGQVLAVRAGLNEDKKALHGNEFRGYSLLEMARASLQMAGVNIRGLDKMGIVAAAFTNSTSDYTNLLADVAHKSMLRGYDEADETFQLWTVPGELPDFKPGKRVDLNDFPALSKVPEGGEYRYAQVGDRGETIQLATYGKMFAITRQAIINDDLGGFTRIPRKMGRAAIRTVGDLVYAVLTSNPTMADGKTLFHADHGNLLASAVISTPSTDALRVAMAKQKDASNNATLNIRLKYLLLPVALGGLGRTVAASEYRVGDSEGANKAMTVPNPMRGLFEVIEDARLDTASSTNWYGCADPAMHDTIEVAYLDGNSQPTLEQQNGWTIDGVEFKVRIDAGVKALDHRTLAKNPN